MQFRKIGIPIAITALLSCVAFGSAKAGEPIATSTTTTTTVTKPALSGSAVYFYTAPQTVLITTLEGRRKDLEKTIDQAYQRGEISSEQGAAMKRELKRIALQTGSNTISYPTAIIVAEDLDLIGTRYGTIVTTAPTYVPLITGSSFTVYTGQTYQLDDLSQRRANLEARILKDLFEGRLTDSRAIELREQLARIGDEANLYLADGSFNAKESRRLYDAFDHVASEIEKSAGKYNGPNNC